MKIVIDIPEKYLNSNIILIHKKSYNKEIFKSMLKAIFSLIKTIIFAFRKVLLVDFKITLCYFKSTKIYLCGEML